MMVVGKVPQHQRFITMAQHPSQKVLREQRKAQGLCPSCGATRTPGSKLLECDACTEKSRIRYQRYTAKRKAVGKRCRRGCEEPAEQGRRYCRPCNDAKAAENTQRRRARNAQGLCSQCGKVPPA